MKKKMMGIVAIVVAGYKFIKINIMKYTFFLLLFVLCTSCNHSDEIAIDAFDIVDNIVKYDSIFSDKSEPMGVITGMEVYGNILITKHMLDEYQFSFIDTDNGNLKSRWGRVGDAPNEFIDFGSGFTISDSQLVFLCNAKKEINYASLYDILQKNDTVNIKKESYPYTIDFRPVDLNILDGNKITIGSFKEGRFGVLDSTNSIINSFGDYPFHYDEVNGVSRGMAFQSKIKSNTNLNKFVIVTLASDIFEIYQLSDATISRTYVSPFNHIPMICKKGRYYDVDYNKSIAGLMKMSVSKDYICFLYSSLSYNEVRKNEKKSDEILCFNWNGEKVKKYILPFSINNFCLDNNCIYGVRTCNEEMIIYRFKL